MFCSHCKTEVPDSFFYCGQCGSLLKKEALLSDPTAPDFVEALPDERRDVTIIFADVKGFTSMCERLDPEEAHPIMNDCFGGLARMIDEEGGRVDKYTGDGVMAIFGAPIAHEDDPMRACRAALSMQDFLLRFSKEYRDRTGVNLQMRIGIHCGLVLAGKVGSEEIKRDYTVMGDAVNLASRMESSAEPGTVLISKEVAKRSGNAFEYGPIKLLSIKGKSHPVEACELLKERTQTDSANYERKKAPFIGRERELASLIDSWSADAAKQPWIEVCGEAGVGKTRLLEEAIRDVDATVIGIVATDISSKRPFGITRRLLQQIIRKVTDDAPFPESRESFLQAVLAIGEDLKWFVDVLWYLTAPSKLGIVAPEPDPKTLRSMLEKGVVTLFSLLAQRQPKLTFVIDSYEHTDRESAALFESIHSEYPEIQLQFIITAREMLSSLSLKKTIINLEPFNEEGTKALLSFLLRGAKLPQVLEEDLLLRAKGIPFYLEEMVLSLVENRIVKPQDDDLNGEWICDETNIGERTILPVSIRASLLSRLDRLKSRQREFLQQCSVQGTRFDIDVVEVIRRGPERRDVLVDFLIPELQQRDFIRDATVAETHRMAFCQPLFQETCYETLVLSKRRALHGETAEALCDIAGGAERVAPEVLAYHYERAGQWTRAAKAHLRAGSHSGELFLNDQALASFGEALLATEHLERPFPEEKQLAVIAHQEMAQVHLRVGAYQEAKLHVQKMRERAAIALDHAEADRLAANIAVRTGDTQEARRLFESALEISLKEHATNKVMINILIDLADFFYRDNKITEAQDYILKCRNIVPPAEVLITIRLDMLEGRVAHSKGRFSVAATLYRRAYSAAMKHGTLFIQARAMNHLGNAARDVGNYEEAMIHFQKALEIWEKSGDIEYIAGAHNNIGNLAMSQSDFQKARSHQVKAFQIYQKIGNVQGAALAQANLALLAIEEGRGDFAMQSALRAVEIVANSGNWLRALILVVLGEAYLSINDFDSAKTVFEGVLAEFSESSHPLAVAGSLRGLGRVLYHQTSSEESVQLLSRAEAMFETLKRSQEAARTKVYLAEALVGLQQKDKALGILEEALTTFEKLEAQKDLSGTKKKISDLTALE